MENLDSEVTFPAYNVAEYLIALNPYYVISFNILAFVI